MRLILWENMKTCEILLDHASHSQIRFSFSWRKLVDILQNVNILLVAIIERYQNILWNKKSLILTSVIADAPTVRDKMLNLNFSSSIYDMDLHNP